MGIPFTVPMGFLFTMTIGFLFTIALGIQLTISRGLKLPLRSGRWSASVVSPRPPARSRGHILPRPSYPGRDQVLLGMDLARSISARNSAKGSILA